MIDPENTPRYADGRVLSWGVGQFLGAGKSRTSSGDGMVSGSLNNPNGSQSNNPAKTTVSIASVLAAATKLRREQDDELAGVIAQRAAAEDEDFIAWQKQARDNSATASVMQSNPANTPKLDTIGTNTPVSAVGTLRTKLMPGTVKPTRAADILPHLADDAADLNTNTKEPTGGIVLMVAAAALIWFFIRSAR